MLAEVRSRDEYLSERDRVIRQEEHRKVLRSLWVFVDYSRDVDDETNCELSNVVCRVPISICPMASMDNVIIAYILGQPCQRRILHAG